MTTSIPTSIPTGLDQALPDGVRLAPSFHPKAQPLAPGSRLGQYQIAHPIGQGGMGMVYEATDLDLHRTVAIKIIKKTVCDQASWERFIGEARVAANLRGPHFVTVYGLGRVEEGALKGHPYYAMECLQGQTLRAWLAQQGPSLGERIALFIDLLEGLCAVHRSGLIHRDLKPENVFVTSKGEVKILDLGLAALAGPPGSGLRDVELTWAESGLAGTFEYIAPEVWHGKIPGPACDVWAVGIMLYEVLSGKHPFWCPMQTARENFEWLTEHAWRPRQRLPRGVPAALAAVVQHSLQLEVSTRFPDASAMLHALRAASRAMHQSRFSTVVDVTLALLVASIFHGPAGSRVPMTQRLIVPEFSEPPRLLSLKAASGAAYHIPHLLPSPAARPANLHRAVKARQAPTHLKVIHPKEQRNAIPFVVFD